jgi:hypothetical protein
MDSLKMLIQPLSVIRLSSDDGGKQIQGGSSPSSVNPSSEVLTGKTTYKKGNLTINVFQSSGQLDQDVTDSLAKEMMKPGLIILPADSTHGDEAGKAPGNIYAKINDRVTNNRILLNPKLKVTHMDEIDLGAERLKSEGFAHSLRTWLGALVEKLGDRFNSLNPEDIDSYNKFIDEAGGPRVIVGGVGAEVPPHIAYIGEEENNGVPVINEETKRIELRPQEAKRRGVSHAATMGMGEFKKDSVELVMMNAKGKRKEDSIEFALKEALEEDGKPVSGLGVLLHQFAFSKNHPKAEFVLNIDAEAAAKSQGLLKQLAA